MYHRCCALGFLRAATCLEPGREPAPLGSPQIRALFAPGDELVASTDAAERVIASPHLWSAWSPLGGSTTAMCARGQEAKQCDWKIDICMASLHFTKAYVKSQLP